MRNRMLLAGLLILSLAGCTTGAGTSPTAASSPGSLAVAASPSVVTSPSVASPTAKTQPLDVAVTWDGSKCTYLGPTVIPDGTLTRFNFTSAERLMLDIVGVYPGTTWDRIVADAKKYPASEGDQTGWLIETGIANIPANSSALYTISSSIVRPADVGGTGVTTGAPVGGYLVGCSTPMKPEGTDVFYPAALLTVAGD